jgi:hypothetical protein
MISTVAQQPISCRPRDLPFNRWPPRLSCATTGTSSACAAPDAAPPGKGACRLPSAVGAEGLADLGGEPVRVLRGKEVATALQHYAAFHGRVGAA